MNTKFQRLPLKPFILNAIDELGFREPSEIQERIIPSALKGESIVGQSQTGTGKTHAYLIPILSNIDPTIEETQAVITAPTRELATQIYHEILKITKHCTPDEMITAKNFVGGTDKQRTIERLKKSPHIVVGTPGRIFDLVSEQALTVYTAKTLIVDEADLMLDMGFIEDVDRIASRMPEDLQMLVFSATIPEKLRPFLKKYMENPKFVEVKPNQKVAENIEHILIPIKSRNKDQLLIDLLNSINPYLCVIFVNTKKTATTIAETLANHGIKAGQIHGDLTPRERKKMMSQIRNLEFQYIVATDLAARGIDIQGISHVINYELPTDLDFYIHRSGRTARAGHSGISVILYDRSDEDALAKLEKLGITFKHMEVVNGEWHELEDRNRRQKRKKKNDDLEVMKKSVIRKPAKVKPGYKKKLKQEIEKVKKRERRLKKNKG